MSRNSSSDLVDLRLDKGQLTVLVVAALAVAAMVFFLGVVVGRRMAELPPEEIAARAKAGAGEAVEAKPDPLAQLDERAVADAKKPAEVEPAEEKPAEAEQKKTEAEQKKPEAEQKKPTEENPPAAEEKQAGDSGSRFVLQVASVRKQESADSELKRLRTRGYQVEVLEADLGAKGKWYRVLVGKFANREAAEAFQKEFEVKETRPGTLVKEIK